MALARYGDRGVRRGRPRSRCCQWLGWWRSRRRRLCWRQYHQPNRRRNCLDLCSVAFAFENCNGFHTFKVPCFLVPRFPPRATWSRVFQSRLSALAMWSRVFQCAFSSPAFSASPNAEVATKNYTALRSDHILNPDSYGENKMLR